jgi:hypothetical protein
MHLTCTNMPVEALDNALAEVWLHSSVTYRNKVYLLTQCYFPWDVTHCNTEVRLHSTHNPLMCWSSRCHFAHITAV